MKEEDGKLHCVCKLNYLDAMRGVFCVVVFIHHFMMAFMPGMQRIIYNDGNLAVMYFFVLSGFVMFIGMYNKNYDLKGIKEYVINLFHYIKKRYLRLLPVVFAAIMGSWIIYIGGVLRRAGK